MRILLFSTSPAPSPSTSSLPPTIAIHTHSHAPTAVVTGGGTGVGAMFASAYVQNGATVYIAARKEGRLREVADALNRKGPGRCEWVVADLSVRDLFHLLFLPWAGSRLMIVGLVVRGA